MCPYLKNKIQPAITDCTIKSVIRFFFFITLLCHIRKQRYYVNISYHAGYLIIDIIVCTEQRENVQINDKQSGEKVGGLRVWKSGRFKGRKRGKG